MKFLFVVQGEGRGHLTQSIALREILVKNGHEVVAVLVGKSNRRDLPGFFSKTIQAPVFRFNSPNFLPAAKNKKANIWITIAYNLCKAWGYFRSIDFIRKKINESGADLVINFYDLLAGLTYVVMPPKVPYICIAHQYMFLHPSYQFPHENIAELELLKFFTRLTCVRASGLLALSMQEKPDFPHEKVHVVPPLLRREVFQHIPKKGDFLLGYLLNDSYADEVIQFQAAHPEVKMRFFWDRKGAEEITQINPNLSFHLLNDHLFVQHMSECMAYATTAGFESVCEAIYLGKPILVVPTHIEQVCNANEASLNTSCVISDRFDLESLLEIIPTHLENLEFRDWVQQSETKMITAIEAISRHKQNPTNSTLERAASNSPK